MAEHILTTHEAEELAARIKLLEDKETKTIGEGYESGAAQDRHHDEG